MKQETIDDNDKALEKIRQHLIDNNLKILDVKVSMNQPVYGLGRRDPVGYMAGYYNVNFDVVQLGGEK